MLTSLVVSVRDVSKVACVKHLLTIAVNIVPLLPVPECSSLLMLSRVPLDPATVINTVTSSQTYSAAGDTLYSHPIEQLSSYVKKGPFYLTFIRSGNILPPTGP
jgi:hypothetical protein